MGAVTFGGEGAPEKAAAPRQGKPIGISLYWQKVV
jgi:hypothetical protein